VRFQPRLVELGLDLVIQPHGKEATSRSGSAPERLA
jgi:hypothetical protein